MGVAVSGAGGRSCGACGVELHRDPRVGHAGPGDDPGDSSITGYQILRRARTGGATLVVHVDDTGSAATLYVDSNVVAGGEYVYRIKARNGAGLSEQSPPLDVDVPDPPAEPESVVVGGSVVTLTYGTDLDERSVPAADAFSVTVAGTARDVGVGGGRRRHREAEAGVGGAGRLDGGPRLHGAGGGPPSRVRRRPVHGGPRRPLRRIHNPHPSATGGG